MDNNFIPRLISNNTFTRRYCMLEQIKRIEL